MMLRCQLAVLLWAAAVSSSHSRHARSQLQRLLLRQVQLLVVVGGGGKKKMENYAETQWPRLEVLLGALEDSRQCRSALV